MDMSIEDYMRRVGQRAREASRAIARADTQTKNAALLALAAGIRRECAALLAANAEDVAAARPQCPPFRSSPLFPRSQLHVKTCTLQIISAEVIRFILTAFY